MYISPFLSFFVFGKSVAKCIFDNISNRFDFQHKIGMTLILTHFNGTDFCTQARVNVCI